MEIKFEKDIVDQLVEQAFQLPAPPFPDLEECAKADADASPKALTLPMKPVELDYNELDDVVAAMQAAHAANLHKNPFTQND